MSLIFLVINNIIKEKYIFGVWTGNLSRIISQAIRLPASFQNKNVEQCNTFMRENEGKTIDCNIADGHNYWSHQIFVHAISDTCKVKGVTA